MKQQDIGIVIVIVFFVGIFSFILANKFVTPAASMRQAERVTEITKDFPQPSAKYFNENAINPTRLIEIAPNNNEQPFAN